MKKFITVIGCLVLLACVWRPAYAKAAEKESEIYGIGSVSKMFSAAAIMRLTEQGMVDLDAPVTLYLPQFQMADDRYQDITVRMLLNHSSGIMGTTFKDCFLFGETDAKYHQIFLDSLKEQELKADPGEYSVYCNDGFTLAELIVEQVSGMEFGRFISREFCQPLGLADTFMPEAVTGTEPLAPIYYGDSRLPYENIQSLASGGIYSTPEDLCRFGQIFTNTGKQILSEQSLAAMSAPEYLSNKIGAREGDSNFNYGLGWDSVDVYPFSRYGIKALSKGGDTGNYGAGLIVLPEQNLTVSVTASGGQSAQCLVMASKIIEEVLKEEGLIDGDRIAEITAVERDMTVSPVPIPEELYKYQGIYAAGEIWRLEFTDRNTALLTSLENSSDMVQEYFYTEDGNFVSTEGKYISYEGLSQAENGIGGITGFRFSEESNGKTYMLGTTYTLAGNKKVSAITMPLAEKIEENSLSGEAAESWKERDGRKYYLVSERHNSSYYLRRPSTKIEVMRQLPGYTGAVEENKNCRILDADTASCELDLPVMTGRDLIGYRFYRADGAEYLETGGFTWIEENAIPGLSQVEEEIPADAHGKWYSIGEEDTGRSVTIEVPDKGAFYLFDRYDTCIGGTLLQDTPDTLILPEDGKLLFVAEDGGTFHISG